MQDLSHSYIVLNGEPKTFQIDSIRRMTENVYSVRFKNNSNYYKYGADKVVWLKDGKWMEPSLCEVYRGGVLQNKVSDIWNFAYEDQNYWRIKYENGFIGDYADSQIKVITSCMDSETAKNTFEYLHHVADINPLGKENGDSSILSKKYEQTSFIDDRSAAACYLNPEKHTVGRLGHGDLIYPFGCNASQKTAVRMAFEQQISVVQGPPGTGKTQTILNIIANIVREGKTVLVVSNNNSAIANVQEKLRKYGLDFIVAPLGNSENKDRFIQHQPSVPREVYDWDISLTDKLRLKRELHAVNERLDNVYALQDEQARLRHEQQELALEWKHYCMENGLEVDMPLRRKAKSAFVINQWIRYQAMADGESMLSGGFFGRLMERIRQWWLRRKLSLESQFDKTDLSPLIKELQILYYQNRQREIVGRLEANNRYLGTYDARVLGEELTDKSMVLFRAGLYDVYSNEVRPRFSEVKELYTDGAVFMKSYPVVLSTTFSARTCVFTEEPYDYLIMDEASQVSGETGTLALTCAKNAVIVGDVLQLSNVVTDEDRQKLIAIKSQFNIADGYDCAKYSFLQSIGMVLPDVVQTILREHYRCHPRIINFCNQKFYGGNLLIMTQDGGEDDVLFAIKTVQGDHAVDQYNQREIDVVRQEVLPSLADCGSIGIITPYNRQVEEFKRQLPGVEVATVHKYQGREKDTIIMSVVDNQITSFVDEAHLLNVAVSRAKKKFVLVVTGNEQEKQGNITDLIDYINYNKGVVTDSKIASIFDYLYEQYTAQRLEFYKNLPKVSEYDSENLTYALIKDVLSSHAAYACLKVLCHIPVRQIIRDTSLMSMEERNYAGNYSTHVDFLIINRVTKKPVMAVETDGYTQHNETTEQYRYDKMKDHIFQLYDFPLLRLSTKGSGERKEITEWLDKIM